MAARLEGEKLLGTPEPRGKLYLEEVVLRVDCLFPPGQKYSDFLAWLDERRCTRVAELRYPRVTQLPDEIDYI